jgi:hypothetical protein
MGDHSLAAKNVQCERMKLSFENFESKMTVKIKTPVGIHTNSGGFGTATRNCSQNWLMGVCGIAQVGEFGHLSKSSSNLNSPFFHPQALNPTPKAITVGIRYRHLC